MQRYILGDMELVSAIYCLRNHKLPCGLNTLKLIQRPQHRCLALCCITLSTTHSTGDKTSSAGRRRKGQLEPDLPRPVPGVACTREGRGGINPRMWTRGRSIKTYTRGNNDAPSHKVWVSSTARHPNSCTALRASPQRFHGQWLSAGISSPSVDCSAQSEGWRG